MDEVIIIGGGPAGIGAALRLRARGVEQVTILEREAALGGVPRHCGHPPFGLREFGRILSGPAYARRLEARAEAAGILLLRQHSVVSLQPGGLLRVSTPDGLKTLQARRVLLATGARESSRAARLVGGMRPLGVLNTGALQAYLHLHGLAPFRRPIVVGTELVALSALATCRSHRIRPVAVLEENATPTARWPLTLLPRLLGIPLHRRASIARIEGSARVEAVTLSDGRRLACDGVLFTGKFLPEASLAAASHLRLDAATGGPLIDQYGRCTDPAYFAAGNLLRPIETAGWSFREGSAIADYIADDLQGGLPSLEGGLTIRAGAGLRFVVPQRLARVAPLRGTLQLRVEAPVRGILRIRAEGETLYRRRISLRPERRVLINLDGIRLPHEGEQLVVEIVR